MSLAAKEISLYHGAKCKIIDMIEGGDVANINLGGREVSLKKGSIVDITGGIIMLHENGIMEVKPILRPLEDMSKEEATELVNPSRYRKYKVGNIKHISGEYVLARKEGITSKYSFTCLNAEQHKYIVENHFDVFNWIDQDKAISALELEPNPYRDE